MAHTAIGIGVGMPRGFPCDVWHRELGRGISMGFQHEGDAGGGVAVLGAQLCEKSLGVIVDSGIAAKLWACTWGRSLPRQESKQLVGVAGFKLFWKTQKDMARYLVRPKDGEVGVLFVLLLDEGWA